MSHHKSEYINFAALTDANFCKSPLFAKNSHLISQLSGFVRPMSGNARRHRPLERSLRRQPDCNCWLTSPANAGDCGATPRATPLPGTRPWRKFVSGPYVRYSEMASAALKRCGIKTVRPSSRLSVRVKRSANRAAARAPPTPYNAA